MTPENIEPIADFLGWESGIDVDEEGDHGPFLRGTGVLAWVGDWIVRRHGIEGYVSLSHEDHMRDYYTHSEKLNREEKYAKIFQAVVSAMQAQAKATYDSEPDGMDLVAMKTAKAILEEL